MTELPLAGVRVADFGIGGVGPWAGSLLAQMGATVVKIEAPNEFILEVLPPWRSATTTYRALNVGKRSVRLNLKDPEDLGRAWTLVEGADVMLENFRSGAMERLGFGFEAVRERNPRIVYLTANGFGSAGDLAGLPCTDPHMQAFSGFASLNGHLAGGERLRFYGAIDLLTSNLIVEGAVAALIERERTGEAQRVEVTMLAAATTALLTQLAPALLGTEQRTAPLGRHGGHVHPDGLYRTQDRLIALTVEDDEAFRRLCDALERPELADDPRFATAADRLRNADELDEQIESALAAAPAEWWLIALSRARVPSGPVHRDHELIAHRRSWEAGLLRPVHGVEPRDGDEMDVAGPPWDFAGVEPAPALAPLPGRHTEAMRGSSDPWKALEAVEP